MSYKLANPLMHDVAPKHGIHDMQRALQADKFYHGPIDGIFGVGSAQAAKTAKWHYGYPKRKVLPTAGIPLYKFLTGAKRLPLSYRIRRHARGYGVTRADKLRSKIVWWAEWGIQNEPSIHYTMGPQRDDFLSHPPGALPMSTDCSGFATACYKWAGAADPSGFGYRFVGFTGTMLDHGYTVPLFQARVGDLVIWGTAPGHHVAVIINVSDRLDPTLSSHGREGGPNRVKLSVETHAQQRPYVIKRYIHD